MASKGSSILDVARTAGVSTSTVSKAFNNRTDISEPVRQRILAIAAELHYVPNALIRSLRRGSTNTIGLFTWETLTEPYLSILSSLSLGFAAGIKALECDVLTYSHLLSRDPDRMAATFLDGRVDGVILTSGNISDSGLRALSDAKLPTVVIYTKNVPESIGYVAIDNAGGIYAVVDHLVELGHKRIAFYAPMQTFDFLERADAYRERLAYQGIEADPALCIVGDFNRPNYAEACDALLALSPRPTALIVGNDDDAYQIMCRLTSQGLRIPQDISVTGFDAVGQDYFIKLTSVRQPVFEVGRTAAALVGAMSKGAPAEECRIVLPVEFAPSESTGPPPNSK